MKTEVTLKQGIYRGFKDDSGVVNFLGIPYAHIPGRWQESVLIEAGTEVHDAMRFGPLCPQPILPEEWPKCFPGLDTDHGSFPYEDIPNPDMSLAPPTDEQCLNINIWTADPEVKGKPVMVFIHGGVFATGGNSIPHFCSERFVADCPDIVVCNINYRVGYLGSFDAAELAKACGDTSGIYANSSNLHMLDIVNALRWVKENIDAFGGNPEKVTINGVQHGGYAVMVLLSMEAAKGLFHRAIISSPLHCDYLKTPEYAAKIRKIADEVTGAKTLEEYLALPQEVLIQCAEKTDEEYDEVRAFDPLGDGGLIPVDPYAAIAAGSAAGVTVLVGGTSGEHDSSSMGLTASETREKCKRIYGQYLSDDILDAFRDNYKERSEKEAYLDAKNDVAIRSNAVMTAQAHAKAGGRTYMYFLDYTPEGSPLRVQQMSEMMYYNHHLKEKLFISACDPFTVQGPNASEAIRTDIQEAFAQFIRCGDPSTKKQPWKPYSLEDKETMVYDGTKWNAVKDYREKDNALIQRYSLRNCFL